MWSVEFESKAVEKEVERLIEGGELTKDDQAIIHAWIQQVAHHGPESIRGKKKVWNDHELNDEWKGYRSPAFSGPGRIIYKVIGEKILIKIACITKVHNYRKKGKK